MIRIINIKSGSKGNCTYVDNGLDGFLLDAGINYEYTKRVLRTHGVLDKLRKVFISHQHSDHNKFQNKGEQIIGKGNVHTTFDEVDGMEFDNIKLKPFELNHDVDNFGLDIEFLGGERLLGATDTFDLINVPRNNYTVYLIESNHDEELQSEYEDGYIARAFVTHMSKQRSNKFLINNIGNETKLIHYIHLSTKYDNPDDCVIPIHADNIKEVGKSPDDVSTKVLIVNENPSLLALEGL